MSPSKITKPKVLALTYPKFAGEDFLDDFRSICDLDVVQANEREGAKLEIATKVKESGPYLAFLIFMGTGPYEDFDEELMGPIVPACKLVVSASAGYNEFDVDWMTRSGMLFCNSRNAVSQPTADMALFLILAVLRDTTRAEKSARTGLWRNDHVPTVDPAGLTLGLLGVGGIGKLVAKRAAGFDLDVKYYNRTRLSPKIEAQYNLTYCTSMEELLSKSDIVSIHCPLNASTKGLISHKEFAQMKDGVFFINTARGPIVDEDALITALESGKVRRAGLDVFAGEPELNPYFVTSDKCTIQPHLGGGSKNAWMNGERECFENIRSYINTGRPVAAVNEV